MKNYYENKKNATMDSTHDPITLNTLDSSDDIQTNISYF